MDFNIKVKAEGIGKQAGATRKQAIQASKSADSNQSLNKNLNINKELINVLTKLIQSNKSLENTIKKNMGRPGGGGSGGGGTGTGLGPNVGGIGASIPFLGAAIATAGFAIMKTKQIGQAYIDLTSQQIGNVGLGGFRQGAGVYKSAEMGGGMAEYARKRGLFSSGVNVNSRDLRTARSMGAVYGLSAGEVMGQAGTFQRLGMNYSQTAGKLSAGGIQSDLPIIMASFSDILEQAIKDGLDASDMNKNFSENIVKMINLTPGKSADAVMNMVRSFQSVQQGVSRGQMGSLEAMYTAQSSRGMLMENLKNPEYIKKLSGQGLISEQQAGKLAGFNGNASYQDLVKAIGPAAAQLLTQNVTATSNPANLMQETIRGVQKQWGTGPEAMQRFIMAAQQQGWSLSPQQIPIAWQSAMGANPELSAEKGLAGLGKREKGVLGSQSGMGIRQTQMREADVIKYGLPFAEASLEAEKALRTMVGSIMPSSKSIEEFGNTIANANAKIKNSSLIKKIFDLE